MPRTRIAAIIAGISMLAAVVGVSVLSTKSWVSDAELRAAFQQLQVPRDWTIISGGWASDRILGVCVPAGLHGDCPSWVNGWDTPQSPDVTREIVLAALRAAGATDARADNDCRRVKHRPNDEPIEGEQCLAVGTLGRVRLSVTTVLSGVRAVEGEESQRLWVIHVAARPAGVA